MDRLEEIKLGFAAGSAYVSSDTLKLAVVVDAAEWLIDEVERLRKIEDAAIAFTEVDDLDFAQDEILTLASAVHHNPRPKDE